MSTQRIYMSRSTRVHKHLRRPCMPEYGSESQTLHIYACVCICEACERCLLMELDVMKVIEVDLIIILIFYSFKMFLLVLDFIKCFYVNGLGCLAIITTLTV